MDIMDMATKMLGSKLSGGGSDSNALKGVLGSLIGGGSSMDIGGLVSGLKEKGLGSIADSWLGDGDNEDISQEQLEEVLGPQQVEEAASKLGTDKGSLLDGLKDMIPQMVDKSSSGGSLLDSLGGLGGLGGLAKKFL